MRVTNSSWLLMSPFTPVKIDFPILCHPFTVICKWINRIWKSTFTLQVNTACVNYLLHFCKIWAWSQSYSWALGSSSKSDRNMNYLSDTLPHSCLGLFDEFLIWTNLGHYILPIYSVHFLLSRPGPSPWLNLEVWLFAVNGVKWCLKVRLYVAGLMSL